MRKIYFLLLTVLFAATSNAQITNTVTGNTNTTPVLAASYPSLAAAITDLNTVTAMTGPVTFNLDAGTSESITSQLAISTAGNAAFAITFQKSGAGANPIVIRTDAGTNTTSTVGGLGDGIIRLEGTDNIVFDGLDLQASNQGIEYGYYTNKTATDACQGVTIKNCNITMTKGTSAYVFGIHISNGTVSTSSATGVTVTANSGRTENVTITGNTISNVHGGIYCRGYSSAAFYDQNFIIGQTGAGNTIQNFGGGAVATTYGVYFIYTNNVNVDYNTINNSGGGGIPHASTFYGTFFSTISGTLSFSNNIVTLANSSTSTTYGMYNANNLTGGSNISNNSFASGTLSSTGTIYLIYNSSSTNDVTVNNNATSGTFSRAGSGTIYCYYNLGSPAGGTETFSNNNFSNISGASSLYGYYSNTTTSQNRDCNSNTFSNLSSTSTNYCIYAVSTLNNLVYNNTINNITGTSSGSLYGIYVTGTNASVYGNSVYNMTGATGTILYGIQSAATGTVNIYKNKIYDLVNNNTASTATNLVSGIHVSTNGTNTNIYNNLIGNITAPNSISTDAIRGINLAATTASTNVNVHFNSIYLAATSTGVNFGSTCIYHTTSTTATSSTLNLRSNIIVNKSTPNGTGLTVAYRRSSTTLTNYGAASNNNLFYAGTPGAANLIFNDGTNSDQTLAAYKTRVSSRDNASITEDAPFLSTTGSSANFLHINTAIPTQVESGGTPVSGITDDFDGDLRNVTTPDVGADEGTFILLDINPPGISYTNIPSTLCIANATLSATITDASGVNTTSGTKPRLYFKKSTDANTYAGNTSADNGWKYVEASNSASPFSFTTNFSLLQTPAASGDIIQYFVVAQDLNGTPNVGINSGTFAITPSSVALTAAAFPIGGSINSFSFPAGGLSGTVTIGAAGTYPTLTGAGGLFEALNAGGLTGNLTANILDASITEPGTNALNQISYGCGGPFTLTIKPNTGVTATLTNAYTGYLIRILSSNVIIDGSNNGTTSRDLTISNTTTTSPSVMVIGSTGTIPITNVTVKNSILINGAQTNSALVVSDGAAPGTAGYFTNITIQNNSIQKAYIANYNIAVAAAGNGSGLNISGNDFNTAGANSIRLVPIYVQGIDGATISNNNIGNMANTADASNITGIWLATATVNTTISGNTISGISGSVGAPRGIAVSSGVPDANVNITGNTITNITSAYSSAVYGIYFFSTTSGFTVQNNMISNIKNTNTSGYSAIGLGLASTLTAANTTVKNNMFWDIAGYGWSSSTTDNGYGINISSGGGYNLYYNTIDLATNQTDATGIPACLIIGSGVTTAASLDIRNNIFSIPATVGTNRYAILSNAANTVFSAIDYNDYYTSGPNLGYIGATNRATLADIQTGFGGNTNSKNAAPVFIGANNLHLSAVGGDNWCLNGTGTPISGITTDIDGDSRGTPPDMGADEFVATGDAVATPSSQIICSGATITTIVLSGTATSYNWTRDNNVAVTGIAASGTGNISGALTNTTNAPVTVTFTITPVDAGSCFGPTITATVTVNPDASITLTSGAGTDNQTVCINTPITPITYAVGGSGTGGSVSGLPAGVTGGFAGGVITLSGTPTASGIFNYTVNTTGPCVTPSANGTITVTANGTVTLTSGAGTDNQTVCINSSITAITYAVGGSGTGGSVSGLPAGVNGTFAGGVITISGTPSASGIFNYTVNTTGPCVTPSANGTISVNFATGGSVAADQTICSGGDPAAFTVSVPSTGGGTLSYQWQSNTSGCAAAFSNIAGAAGATYDPPSGLTVTTYYRRVTTSTLNSVACSANSNCVTVTVNDVTGGTVAADQTICSGGDPAAFTETVASTGSGTLSYQWQSNTSSCAAAFSNIAGATGATYDPPAGLLITTYYRRVTTSTLNSVTCTANSNCVTVTVNDVTGGTVAADQAICSGGDPAAFTETVASTGSGTLSYQWQSSTTDCTTGFSNIAGATGTTYDPPSGLTVTTYYKRVTTSTLNSVACTANSNCITVTVNPLPNFSGVITQPTTCVSTDGAITLTISGSGLSENFDGVVAPALPAGWVATNAIGGAPLWVTSNAGTPAPPAVSLPNAIFIDDPAVVTDKQIVTPSFTPVAGATVSFANNYSLESTFDGGVLEISINGGAYQDIITAGGSFVSNGYNGVISSSFGSPIAGRNAWTGASVGFLTTTVNLPAGAAGLPCTLKFRMGSDNSVSSVGWRVDDFSISGGAAYTFAWTGPGVNPTSQNQTGLAVGNYGVTVTNAVTNCSSTANFALFGPGGCDICPTIPTETASPNPVCKDSTVTLTASGLTNMGISYGIEFKYSLTNIADPYTGGTSIGIVPNGSLTGGGTIATLNTTFPASGNYIIYAILTPTPTDPSCRPKDSVTLTVNPTPTAVATPASQTICSAGTITTIVLSGTGTTYNWTRDNNATVTGIAANGSGNISGTLTNTTNAPVTVTFTITPIANGCPGLPITATVLVNPTPDAVATPASQTVCSANPITTIVLSGAVSGTTFNWTRDNTVTVTGIAASGSGNISGSLTNTTTAPVTVTFTITPTANGCPGTPITATVLVNPTPNAVATPSSQTICSGATITTIVLTGAVSGTTFNWTRDNTVTVTGIAASGSGNISGALTNTTAAPITVTFTITPTANGCPGAAITATVLVNPTPNAVATPSSQIICSATPITTIVLSGAVSGTTYAWTRDNLVNLTGIAASGSGNISGTLTNATNVVQTTTFTIIPTANGCPGAPITTTVTVNPTPTVSPVPPNQTVCNTFPTAPVTFTGPVAGTTFNWVNNTPSIGLAASGSGNIASFNAINLTNAPVTATITVTPVTTPTGTVNFNFTGAVQTFVVPSGVTSVTIQAFGAQGNANAAGVSQGGLGGSASGTLAVTPGETLFINVGGGGTTSVTGGFNGGGNGGTTGTCLTAPGGGGGGASDVRQIANALANRRIVAAGGGGTAGNRVVTCARGAGGGGGGGYYGGGGGSGYPGIAGVVPTGGTQAAGGAGGITGTTFGATNGLPGVLGIGGNGGNEIASAQAGSQAIIFGSGIGGGLTGGSGQQSGLNNFTGQSGAGGSSYIGGVTSGSTTAGVRSGNGLVTISYATAGPSCTGPSSSFTITVNPTPNAVATPNTQTICSGTAMTPIVLSGNVSGTTFNWVRNNTVNVTGIANSGSGNISGTPVNITTVQQTVTYTITPVANGCTGPSITATLIVNIAPTITCPANITVNNTPGFCGANVTYPPATATGSPAPVITYSQASGTFFPVGTTTVTATATNACGVATCTFTITVLDVQAPTITCPAPITVNTDVGVCTATIPVPNPITADNCAVTQLTWVMTGATVASSPATGINNIGTFTFNLNGTTGTGVTTVTYTVKDAAGNTTTCSFTVTVNDIWIPVISGQPVNQTVCVGTNAVFTVTASVPAGNPLTYRWQTWNGSAWVDISPAQTAATLTLNAVTFSMNTNSYRCILTGRCSVVTSGFATLYVNQLPAISLVASRSPALLPGQVLNITTVVSPGGGTYVWKKNGVVIAGATGSSLNGLTVSDIGTYTCTYTDLNGCVSTSAALNVTGQVSDGLYIYPVPNDGRFHVRFYNDPNEEVTIKVIDMNGRLVYEKKVVTTIAYTDMLIDITTTHIISTETYIVEVIGPDGRLIGAKKIQILK